MTGHVPQEIFRSVCAFESDLRPWSGLSLALTCKVGYAAFRWAALETSCGRRAVRDAVVRRLPSGPLPRWILGISTSQWLTVFPRPLQNAILHQEDMLCVPNFVAVATPERARASVVHRLAGMLPGSHESFVRMVSGVQSDRRAVMLARFHAVARGMQAAADCCGCTEEEAEIVDRLALEHCPFDLCGDARASGLARSAVDFYDDARLVEFLVMCPGFNAATLCVVCRARRNHECVEWLVAFILEMSPTDNLPSTAIYALQSVGCRSWVCSAIVEQLAESAEGWALSGSDGVSDDVVQRIVMAVHCASCNRDSAVARKLLSVFSLALEACPPEATFAVLVAAASLACASEWIALFRRSRSRLRPAFRHAIVRSVCHCCRYEDIKRLREELPNDFVPQFMLRLGQMPQQPNVPHLLDFADTRDCIFARLNCEPPLDSLGEEKNPGGNPSSFFPHDLVDESVLNVSMQPVAVLVDLANRLPEGCPTRSRLVMDALGGGKPHLALALGLHNVSPRQALLSALQSGNTACCEAVMQCCAVVASRSWDNVRCLLEVCHPATERWLVRTFY